MLRPPAVGPDAPRRRVRDSFTLIEVLVVMGIIATLGLIALGIFQGVRHKVADAQARSDLAALGQALELYRRQYGDYPQTADTPGKLYQALTGRLGPAGAVLHGRNLLPDVPVPLADPAHPDATDNSFVDPWGNPYQYVFFTHQAGTAPLRRGYVLFSFGPHTATETLPSRADVVPSTSGAQGGAISSAPVNARNIYAGQ
jgi:general secretion pathway protein G